MDTTQAAQLQAEVAALLKNSADLPFGRRFVHVTEAYLVILFVGKKDLAALESRRNRGGDPLLGLVGPRNAPASMTIEDGRDSFIIGTITIVDDYAFAVGKDVRFTILDLMRRVTRPKKTEYLIHAACVISFGVKFTPETLLTAVKEWVEAAHWKAGRPHNN